MREFSVILQATYRLNTRWQSGEAFWYGDQALTFDDFALVEEWARLYPGLVGEWHGITTDYYPITYALKFDDGGDTFTVGTVHDLA